MEVLVAYVKWIFLLNIMWVYFYFFPFSMWTCAHNYEYLHTRKFISPGQLNSHLFGEDSYQQKMFVGYIVVQSLSGKILADKKKTNFFGLIIPNEMRPTTVFIGKYIFPNKIFCWLWSYVSWWISFPAHNFVCGQNIFSSQFNLGQQNMLSAKICFANKLSHRDMWVLYILFVGLVA